MKPKNTVVVRTAVKHSFLIPYAEPAALETDSKKYVKGIPDCQITMTPIEGDIIFPDELAIAEKN